MVSENNGYGVRKRRETRGYWGEARDKSEEARRQMKEGRGIREDGR
jgi:hypothetical protein